MAGIDPGLRRVSVHDGSTAVDLALPARVPVAVLMPSIIDFLGGRDDCGSGEPVARRYRLSRPGAAAFSTSTTLAQQGIRDGEMLILTESATPPPAPRYEDVAEAVSATLDSTARPQSSLRRRQAARLTGAIAASVLTGIGGLTLMRNACTADVAGATIGVTVSAGLVALLCAGVAHRTHGDAVAGLALGVIATAFTAVAGYLAVPGVPGLPNVVLGAMTAAVTSVLALRLAGCGAVTLTALACVATIIAAAAFVGVITAAPPHVIGSVSALISLSLLGVAARISIALAGLSPQLPPAPDLDARAIRAGTWLTSLLAAFACGATVGAVVTVLPGAPGPPRIVFGALAGALLVLRAGRGDGRGGLVFATCGTAVIATTFAALARGAPSGAWTAAMTAALVAAAMCLGFVASAAAPSPVLRRVADVLEGLALVAMVPITCWVCGLYGAVRGLSLT
ncbi:type VII secretion integral membrane protein EccD [Mycobacterium sp. 852002-50816_SCH5313054-b]|uniref:type VII secretion integral membrane protein EccD n=1 Tax=Mycobacterium sp. 852002-50816_SCH5313054-b TaxID=1834092 RepID=UPI0007FF870B|nr:type VII secretion integral membrane protein EccD [Mycobacterium sp. 852002-50816_SCH5313054-b]OBF60272.1 type VII secretion integral membrane protein EccD [Mycobacterium sp. 852002-50816_SCH5313054-b]